MKRDEILECLYHIKDIIKDMNNSSAEIIEASFQIAPIEVENKYNIVRIIFVFLCIYCLLASLLSFEVLGLVIFSACLVYLVKARIKASNYVVYTLASIFMVSYININVLGLFILGIPAGLITFILVKKFKSSYSRSRNEDIERNESLYELIEAHDKFIEASKEALQVYVDEFYPADCLSVGATQELIKLFENRRADTMKEALNLLDTKRYREKMEASQQRIENMVYNQNVQLNSINNQLRWSNAMQIIGLAQLNDIRRNHSQAEIIIRHK